MIQSTLGFKIRLDAGKARDGFSEKKFSTVALKVALKKKCDGLH